MKKLITIILILVNLAAFGQTDSTKKDTVRVNVPVYIVEVKDTVQVDVLMYRGRKNQVQYCSPGYWIRTRQFANGRPIQQSEKIIGALDERKRPVQGI